MQQLQVLVLPGGEFWLGDEHMESIRNATPQADVRVADRAEATPADLDSADVIFGIPDKEWLTTAKRLRWLQLPFAGTDGWTGIRPDILLTKASGVFGIPIAEWVLGSMLMLTRNLHLYRDQQHKPAWQERPGAREIYGSTVGIVGLGDLGREVAKRAAAFGCRVLANRRTRGGEAVPFVDELLPLDELLPQVDFLVLALPHTPETDGMISAERLASLPRGAYLVNVGRGRTVDEAALIESLRSGHLAGAALDVTAVEPLSLSSPLWQMEQVIIAPHTSGRSPKGNADRRTALFCENLRRYAAGEALRNVVDRVAGY